jgi:hypothetical protein
MADAKNGNERRKIAQQQFQHRAQFSTSCSLACLLRIKKQESRKILHDDDYVCTEQTNEQAKTSFRV